MVKYDQAGNDDFGPAPQVVESVAAQKAGQTIAVTTHAPSSATFGASFSVAAGAPGGAASFSSAGACSNSGSTFTMTSGTGTCTVKYDQAGNDDYSAAPQVVESVTAQKAGQTIAVTTHAPAVAAPGAVFTVAATAPGGAVAYSSSGVCTNSGATFTVGSGAGTCTVRYDQVGSAGYNPAAQVVESVTVTPARVTLTVAKSGTGGGAVSSSAGAINCRATCTADFDAGTSVTLTATADAGSTFAGWTGGCTGSGTCTVTLDAAKTVTAIFNLASKPAPAKCVVPNIRGKTLASAKKKLAAAHCRLGKVTTAKSKTVAKGKVLSQSPRAGTKRTAGAKVNVVLSRGKR